MLLFETILNELGQQGDPAADAVIAELASTANGLAEANKTLAGWTHTGQRLPRTTPRPLRAFLAAAIELPPWADRSKLDDAFAFFQDDGAHVTTALSLGSLVQCYSVPVGAKLLATTHRLAHPQRRMAETGRFVMGMMERDAFYEPSTFIVDVVKVRLIHATVRHHLREERAWDEAADGCPISQEFLLGAWGFFTVGVLDMLDKLRISVTPAETAGYLHAWRVVPFAGTVLDRFGQLVAGAEYRLISHGHDAALRLPARLTADD